jgi:hypothetical protein
MTSIFVADDHDTNLFFECKPLEELPSTELDRDPSPSS